MKSTIQQLAIETSQSLPEKIIPIFIGTSKLLHSEIPTFKDTTYNTIQLTSDQDYIIEESSINPSISYWKENASTSINYTLNTKTITLSIPTTTKFDANSLFVFKDSNDILLHSSTIKTFVYSTDSLISISLNIPYNQSGNFACSIISKITKTVPYIYDNSTNTINLNYIDRTTLKIRTNAETTIQFPINITNSVISYNKILKTIKTSILSSITNENILLEKNIEISKGLSLSDSVVIISIPNETFIYDAIETIKTLNYGYYIVPIDLSINSINLLYESLIKNVSNDLFFSLIIPSTLISSITLSSGTYTSV